jgi:Lipocalin-like domain
VLEEPNLGADPIGIIVYDRAGNVSAQLMKRHRTDTTATPQGTQATNNSSATGGYDAYFGKYEVDTKAHTVTHHPIGAIALADIGKSLTRSYEFVGGELRLSFEATNNGVSVRRTVRFRRAVGPPN